MKITGARPWTEAENVDDFLDYALAGANTLVLIATPITVMYSPLAMSSTEAMSAPPAASKTDFISRTSLLSENAGRVSSSSERVAPSSVSTAIPDESNTAPLVWSFLYGANRGKFELILDNAPARSAELLSENRIDAALVPVAAPVPTPPPAASWPG